MAIRSYHDLFVWQRAMGLAEDTYKITRKFPRSELFGLGAQMQRCAVSIPSNIAEGHARDSTRDFLRFLSIASGSNAELGTQLLIATRLGYIIDDEAAPLIERTNEIGKMLRGLRRRLRQKLPIPSP